MTTSRTRAFNIIGAAGVAFVVLFVILRASGGVGSFQPVQPGWIGLLNVTKYPPSLTFLLLTLGVDFILLALFEHTGAGASRWTAPLRVFGAAPLFFFFTHLFLYGFIGKWYSEALTFPVMLCVVVRGAGRAVSAVQVAYGEFKQRRPPNSLWRML